MSEPTHSYFDWQLSTLMLAYDAVQPLHRDDDKGLETRQRGAEQELHDMVHRVLPKDYLENPQRDFPAEMVVLLTRATISRAADILAGKP